MRRIYYVSGTNNPYQYSRVGGPCEVAMVSLKDLRPLLSVARAAERDIAGDITPRGVRGLKSHDALMDALDKLNAKGKGRK